MKIVTSKRFERSIFWGTAFIDVLIIVGTFFFLWHSRTHLLEGLHIAAHNLVQLFEQRIADKARLIDDAVVRVERLLEEQLKTGAVNPKRLQWMLDLEQEQLPEIDAIRITNAQGDVLWGKGILPGVNASYADRDFFRAHRENQAQVPIVTPPLQGKISGLWVIAFTRSYHTPDGQFAGVISAAVPIDTFNRILHMVNLGPTGTVVMRYADGGLVARMPTMEGTAGQPGNKQVSGEYLRLLNSNASAGEFQTHHSPDSVARHYAFRRVMGWPFTIAVGLVENEHLAPWKTQAIWGALLLGVLLLMTSTVSWVTILHLREQAIRAQEREADLVRRRILLDQSRDGIVVLDNRGKVYEANLSFAGMLAYSPEEVRELSLWDWDARWSREELEVMLAQVGTEGTLFETQHRRKDGRIIDVEISTNGAEFGGNKLVFCVCRDISERNKARDALKASEEKYRIIFENQLYAIAIFDLVTYRLLDVNEAYVRLYGYSREELLDGMTILDISAEGDQSEAAVRQAIDQGSIFVPLRYQRKQDGTVVPVELVGGPVAWGGRRAMFSLAHDISGRQQAENDLRESEALYRFLVTSLNDGFFVCNAQGILTYANAAMAKMIGAADPESLMGRHIFEFIAPVDLERVEAHFNEAVTHQIVPISLEIIIAREDGQELWVEVKPTVVARDQGLFSIQGLVIDITQRKKDAEALHKSRERLHLALQATKDAIWDWNLQTGEIYYSPRWFLMVGYAAEELQVDPQLWRRLLHPDDLERADQTVAEAIASQTYFEIETRLHHKAGHYVPVLTRGYILRDDSGTTIRLAGTNTDLSEHKRVEEERRQWERQALQLQKVESLSRMAGAIAHHFNNLLSVVLGNIEISLEDLPQDEPVVANLRAASRAGDRAVEVSSLLLTYLGQTEGHHECLDLAHLYRQSLPLLQVLLQEQVALETRFPKTGTFVRGNANHLQRMLKNLIVNAAEAIGEGPGTIGLSLTTVPVAEVPSQHRFPIDWEPDAASYVCLQIQDSGEGINAADIEQLFDPFFSSKFTGRGLGLSVVMGIVRSHAGGITVESTPRLGSVFRVYLPLVEPDLSTEQTGTEGDGTADLERTILLVEDEEQVRLMTESMLSRLGFAYLSAENGAEALILFKRHADSIALVVCDLIMPGMGGWETMDALKEIVPTLPWVMTSGYDETQVMREERKQYPQVFLQKPYKKDELGAAIDAAFKQAAQGGAATDVGLPRSNEAVTKA